MTFEKSIELYNEIVKVENDFLRDEFIEKAVEYARIRTNWHFMDTDERRAENKGRTIKHDAFIDTINAILRFMKTNGANTDWYDELPDFRSKAGRKEWGDFACFIHCYLGIRLR